MIFECFSLFPTMRTHAQGCIRWSKYTTNWITIYPNKYETDTREWCLVVMGETPNLGGHCMILGCRKKGHFGALVLALGSRPVPCLTSFISLACKIISMTIFKCRKNWACLKRRHAYVAMWPSGRSAENIGKLYKFYKYYKKF